SRLMSMERKLATVLFVDIVDSTALVTGMDPEVARRRVNRFFDHASQCIERHGGTVEKFAGDAVLAAFGIPQAHEDDAERAIRGPLVLRSCREPLGAWRVVCAAAGARPILPAVRAPLIARESELELLENTFTRTLRDRRAHLFTIYGEPGIGKSRLAREFVDG